MSLIKIIANNIELDIVKETLSIVKENNALINDFKVSYSNYPFLIVENGKTIKALGTRDIASLNKPKIIPVTVEELGEKYFGEIQILSYLNGFRKVTLKYATELLTIMEKKISDFMPVVSVIPNEVNPVPFFEESEIDYDGADYWSQYPIQFLDKVFPEVKWQFPTMLWKNKFGVDLPNDDTWYLFDNYINQYDNNGNLIVNTLEYNSGYIIQNRNVVAPQVFLLSPLYYALKSIGFTANGDVMSSEFIKRILFLSEKNNLSKANYLQVHLPNLTYYSNFGGFYESKFDLLIQHSGTYTIKYSFDEVSFPSEPNHEVLFKVFFLSVQGYYQYDTTHVSQNFSGTIEVEVDSSQIGMYIYISYFTHYNFMPNHSISIDNDGLNYYQMHPTIQLGRYLPDWTFGTYLNELKNIFNLEIRPENATKTLYLNFNENEIINGTKEIISKSFAIDYYEPKPYEAFLLKYQNDTDTALWITNEGTEIYKNQTSDFLNTINSKFKFIPVSNTANLSEEIITKDGVGLMIYDETRKPFISNNYNLQTLSIVGENGIYEHFHKVFVKFRLNTSLLEITGPFTEFELSKIIKKNRIYIDHQEYLISSLEYEETPSSFFKVKFRLESINF